MLHGTVIDETAHRPLAGVQIRVVGSSRTTYTDSVGRYRLDSLNGTSFSVRARASGYFIETRKVDLPPRPSGVCGRTCPPWTPVAVLNFYMRSRPVQPVDWASDPLSAPAHVGLPATDPVYDLR